MLAPLSDYKQSVTLIQNSGVQFLDFGVTPFDMPNQGCFVRKTANGPLLRLDYDIIPGKYSLPTLDASAPEVVKPEVTQPLSQSLQMMDGVWLPLPFLRFNPPRTFVGGPDNWARIQIRQLASPDSKGNTHRIVVAFDTQLAEDEHLGGLAPLQSDVRNGTRFTLAWQNQDVAEFLDQTWVDGWLREVFTQYATREQGRSEEDIARSMKLFEYQAHWMNVLTLLSSLNIPEVKIVGETLQTPAIPVDLVLDVGNTHTCGVLIEDHGPTNDGLRQTMALQIRNLSEPQYLNALMFTSRMEFNEARFGKTHFSVESGRDEAFMWPAIVRVGDEARNLAIARRGTEGNSGISSPRRYLWDETPGNEEWRFSQFNTHTQREPLATAWPLMNLMNDEGQPLYQLPPDERLPVFSPHYTRSSLMMHMLCELLMQALAQINSVSSRLAQGYPTSPRQLRTLILTLPSAMPKQEKAIFRQRMEDAIAVIWKALGWHPADDDFSRPAERQRTVVPVPAIHLDWDEASCGQLVWLYNEVVMKFAGKTDQFFSTLARKDRLADDEQPGRAIRVATIDIGGGTTDMAITRYQLDEGTGSNVKIAPTLLFREGFKIAGDDILLDVIQLAILPALEQAFQQAGVVDASGLMGHLFGESGRMDTQGILRQQAALQLFMPLGHKLLSAWEEQDSSDPQSGLYSTFGDLLTTAPGENVLQYINKAVQGALPPQSDGFNLMAVPLDVPFAMLHDALMTGKFRITAPLHALCEAVSHYCCDVLLITGRPGCLPGVQALIRYLQPVPVNRLVWLENYPVHEWYPFSEQGRIGNPKSTAAIGAMLCSLALDLRLPGFNFKAADIKAYSTIRHLGVLDSNNMLSEENVWYQDIDLDNPGEKLATKVSFPLRGNVTLGFRQLDNARWPATPLYTLSIDDAGLSRAIAGDGVLNVRLQLQTHGGDTPLSFELADAWLQDGRKVPLSQLSLKLNTLAYRQNSANYYWIDSGSVYA